MSHPDIAPRHTLRSIAAFEAFKGTIALLLLGLVLSLAQVDLHTWVLTHMQALGFNPSSHYPAVVLAYADVASHSDWRVLMGLLLAYAGLRFTEALGLWHNKRWAKYLGAGSGAIYIPFEIDHLLHQPNLGSIAILGINVYIVVYLVMHLSLEKTA